MSEKKFDVGALVNNGLGHPLARTLAEGLWKSQMIRHFASKNPEMMSVISKGVMALTSLLEVGGDHPIARFANYVTETIATENLELLKQFQKNPDDPALAEQVGQKVDAALKAAEASGVIIAFDHVHKDAKCVPVATLIAATTTTRAGKDGKSFTSPSPVTLVTTDMSSALAAGRPLCGICYPAGSFGKPEGKQEKSKEVVAGRNFMEYVMRLRSEEPEEYLPFWKTYLLRLDGPDGAALATKFQEAFNGKHSYEAFRFVVSRPHRDPETGWEEWHHALDALLGKVTPVETLRKQVGGFLSEEKRQTEEMFRAMFAWLEKANAARKEQISEKKASIAKLDEAWQASRKARTSGKLGRNIVIASLLVILASWYAIQRVDNNSARSDASEQKVETSNVR